MIRSGKPLTLPNPKKRVTIRDVAHAAGVSTQTVSRVMNNISYVSEGTRKRVETVVEEMGYRPSTLARSLLDLGRGETGLFAVRKQELTGRGLSDEERERLGALLQSLASRVDADAPPSTQASPDPQSGEEAAEYKPDQEPDGRENEITHGLGTPPSRQGGSVRSCEL